MSRKILDFLTLSIAVAPIASLLAALLFVFLVTVFFFAMIPVSIVSGEKMTLEMMSFAFSPHVTLITYTTMFISMEYAFWKFRR